MEQLGDRVFERALQRLGILDALLARLLAQRREQPVGRVDAAADKELGDGGVQHLPRARETVLQARGPGKRCYHRSVHSSKGQIRIIAGQYRGRRIRVASRPGLRPTPDRVRETLFNWLGQWLDGESCLDLFAGSGALGFEAASRGAERVVMVESDRGAYSALQAARELIGARAVE